MRDAATLPLGTVAGRRPGGVALAWASALALAALVLVVGERVGPLAPTSAPAAPAQPFGLEAVAQSAVGSASAPFSVVRRGGVLVASGGGLTTTFRASGVHVTAAGGTLDLAFAGIGRGARLTDAARATPAGTGNVARYHRPGVVEWYRNGPFGLEQGFTLSARPRGTGAVSVALDVGGSLVARTSGGAIAFASSSGAEVLRYGGLSVLDAAGRRVRAALQLAHGQVLIRVWDGGASYPLRIDPFIQQGPKLTASDESGAGRLGGNVALSADGTTALVGGYGDDGSVGAAWVFRRSGAAWTQEGPKLTPSDESGAGVFGSRVALSADGDTALIGGVGNDSNVGAAWVFTRSGSTWTQQGPKLTASDELGAGLFGTAVALSDDGDVALIGAPQDDSGIGAAWTFTRAGSDWTQEGKKLIPGDGTGTPCFGDSTALSADAGIALIGGMCDSASVGAAWAFKRADLGWTQQGPKLTGDDTVGTAFFGTAVNVSADGNTAVVGGPADDGFVGAGWVFKRAGSVWTQQGPKLTARDESGHAAFGSYSVGLSADGSTALFGGHGDNGEVGAAWLFLRSGSTWTQEGPKLTARDESGPGGFGSGNALSDDGRIALIGGPNDSATTGAAWIFAAPRSTFECKNGGWKAFGFRTQGDCVSWVATHPTAPAR
jgi:hypothetical protein